MKGNQQVAQQSVATEVLNPDFSFADPVFVLCNGRSGSTLLRFLLDAHPELACPPETNLPALCAQLATVWSLIEGAPLSVNRGDEPPAIPDAAITGIRATMDRMVGSYLDRRGKKRYCDKSLGTAQFAKLLMRVYPEARFICLYRHPMDVIASGLEACPWGLSGYGFDQYIASTPGNAVMALARFWADNAATTLAAEEQFADRCLRVRYEDLVTDPEGEAAQIFDFLETAPAPGISAECFSPMRERSGPGDYKIWYTSKITSDSIGRGWAVPARMIAPQVLAGINELTRTLGYLPIDDAWGTSAPPLDLRLPVAADDADGDASTRDSTRVGPIFSKPLADRLRIGLTTAGQEITDRWRPYGEESFVAIWVPDDPAQSAEHWLVDLGKRSITSATSQAQEESAWDIVGSAMAWEQVLHGQLNLSVALRACRLRYCGGDESGPLASDARIGLLASLLALTSW